MSPIKGLPSSEVTELFCLVPSKFFTSRLSIFNQFTSGGYKYGYKVFAFSCNNVLFVCCKVVEHPSKKIIFYLNYTQFILFLELTYNLILYIFL